ncbi:MAG: type II toxin-antitoxin system RelE/ParE family toxin [Saprospiraceae bacterium]|nr:type II toxin-antitoxin system RelE/ParE family toxin [Saprospiraceae bacterium]
MIELSQEADRDLENIFDYTLEQHGASQAITYVSSFDRPLVELSENPLLGRDRPEIRAGLRSLSHRHHIIFYRQVENGKVRILRILHGARDLPRNFEVP